MYRASSYNMRKNQQMHRIFVIRLYYPLDALHVSDYISPSSGAAQAYTGIYQMQCTAYKMLLLMMD